MPKAKRKFPCRYCDRADFKSPRAVNQHIRQAHKNKKGRGKDRKPRKGTLENPCPENEVFIQKPINFCCFCGEQLPNATIIRK